jgi:exodeoxyribonuclease I
LKNATFFWHDYETFGADPARDRPVQFAGVRTNAELEEVGDPVVLHCRPPPDYLPQPEACLITGITPQFALEHGVSEREFVAALHHELAQPGTCGVGYNSIRFDDEFTRHALYRNFFDPYEREWRNGNSRWDLIDVLRMARALRPDGLAWPDKEDGRPSFRLEDLTRANGIEHGQAHDALADARATLALARKLRTAQPRLFEHALRARDKPWVKQQLNIVERKPLLHISTRFSVEHGCAALVVPLAIHPTNTNSVIACNLLLDPEPLATLDATTLRVRLYTATADLPAGTARVPLKEIHVNRSPMLAPAAMLTPDIAERLHIDVAQCRANLERVLAIKGLSEKLRAVYAMEPSRGIVDPEQALYSGGFFGDADRRLFAAIRALDGKALATRRFRFDDERLASLLFRYRARNFPESLDAAEMAQWRQHCRARFDGDGAGSIRQFRTRIQALRVERAADARAIALLDALEHYGAGLCEAS